MSFGADCGDAKERSADMRRAVYRAPQDAFRYPKPCRRMLGLERCSSCSSCWTTLDSGCRLGPGPLHKAVVCARDAVGASATTKPCLSVVLAASCEGQCRHHQAWPDPINVADSDWLFTSSLVALWCRFCKLGRLHRLTSLCLAVGIHFVCMDYVFPVLCCWANNCNCASLCVGYFLCLLLGIVSCGAQNYPSKYPQHPKRRECVCGASDMFNKLSQGIPTDLMH
jgi:hypothetical protein